MPSRMDELAEQIYLFSAALYAFEETVGGISPFFRDFSKQFMAGATPPRRRRLLRDWARANRRPALIHNGRKAR